MITTGNNGGRLEADRCLIVEIEKHDDEDEEDHDRAGIDEDLDDPDEVGIESDEEPGQAHEGKDHGKSARNGVSKGH